MPTKFRHAQKKDLPKLIELLVQDELGHTREDASIPLHVDYINAFEAISADKNNEIIVMEVDDNLVAMMQLTFIPNLTLMGSWRCLIEGVFVCENKRGQGFGSQMLLWAIERAKEKGCKVVQLTSNKVRKRAINFYKTLGFVASHEGLKLTL